MPEEKIIQDLQNKVKELGEEPLPLESDLETDKSLEAPEPGEDPDQEDDLDKVVGEEQPEKKVEPSIKQPDIIREKSQERAQRRGKERQQMRQEIAELKETVNKLLDKGKTEEASNELTEYAKEQKLDPVQLEKLVGIIEKRVGKVEKQPEIKTKEKEPTEEYNEAEEKEIFDGEWDELLPKIEEQHPHASASQIREAKKLMDTLSHSDPKLASYDLEDIFNSPKYQQKFKDLLFSPKKKTFESGRNVDKPKLEEDIDWENINIDTPEKALKAKEALFKASNGRRATMFSPDGKVTELD